MRRFVKPATPQCLRERGIQWTALWVRNQALGNRFSWNQYQGRPANQILTPILKDCTDEHCSYCDAFPVEGVSEETIDHFKPKSTNQLEAFSWRNLFYCCSACQGIKLENYSRLLLKPDASTFSFETYFEFVALTGEIVPNPQATNHQKRRANKTIELLGLNERGRPASRIRLRKTWREQMGKGLTLQELPYRFIIDLAN